MKKSIFALVVVGLFSASTIMAQGTQAPAPTAKPATENEHAKGEKGGKHHHHHGHKGGHKPGGQK